MCDLKYMDKKTDIVYLKAQIFIFLSEVLSMWNQIIKLRKKIQITQQDNKSKLEITDRIKEIIIKGKI